jgi:hypothetical protein
MKIAREGSVVRVDVDLSVRSELQKVNLDLIREIDRMRDERTRLMMDMDRLREILAHCIPPTSDEWFEGLPARTASPDWRDGWDSCRQKIVDLFDDAKGKL